MFHSPRVHRLARTTFFLALFLLLPACGKNRVTRTNYDKINTGMSVEEVEAVLGPGTKEEGDGSNVAAQFGVNLEAPAGSRAVQTYVWEKGNKTITVIFLNGKVHMKRESGL